MVECINTAPELKELTSLNIETPRLTKLTHYREGDEPFKDENNFPENEEMIPVLKGEPRTEGGKSVSAFENVLENVGSNGKYQKLLIAFFLIPLSIFNAMASVNKTLLFTTPEHTCHVPGRFHKNYTIGEWKNLTIPWEKDSLGQPKLSSCFMHDAEVVNGETVSAANESQLVKECEHGWDFDTSEWLETPVTKYEWVCERKDIVTTMFSLSFAGNAVGNIIFSIVSDRYGRKPTFYFLLMANIVCSILMTVIPTEPGFGLFNFLLGLPFWSLLQVPYIIVMELCGEKLRSIATVSTFISDVLGNCLMSLIAYFSTDWKIFIYSCHLPTLIFLFYYKFLPESPRWLLSKSRMSECERYLRRIAKTNGRTFSEATRDYLLQAQKEEVRSHSLTSILKSFTLVKHLLLTSLILSTMFVMYAGILLNIHNMPGNKSVIFFILMLFDIPGEVFASVSAQYLGRRLSLVVIVGATSLSCALAAVFASDPWVLIVFCGCTKMFASATCLVVFMQISELFPTPVRNSAYGLISMIATTAVVCIPPLIAMGESNALLPYYILLGLGLFSFLLCTFLPETVGRPLPQTMSDAILIGKNQPYFSIIHKWNAHKYYDK